MKKIILSLFLILFLFTYQNIQAQGDASVISKEILKAYKTKNAELLKKYATGIIVYAINDDFFENKDGKPLVEVASKWDGKIKEIRYSKGDIMGKTVLLASVYFSDNVKGNLNVVILTSYEKSDWKAFVYGITESTKEEFEEGSLEIPDGEKQEENVVKSDHSEFSIEMASGDIYNKPTTEKLVELLKSLNDDNFFLILNSKLGFLQASTSEKGYIVQYSDDSGMFEAEAYFTMEMLVDIFKAYIDGGKWKENAKWIEM
jgi:hypothetical protein